MTYFFNKIVDMTYDDAISAVREAGKAEGFGVLTEIDVKATLKEKIDVDFRKYIILGFCNPPFAHKALLAEEHIGLMLPCNIIVQERVDGTVEVAAIDPVASMTAVGNDELGPIAAEVREKLKGIIEGL